MTLLEPRLQAYPSLGLLSPAGLAVVAAPGRGREAGT